MSGTVLRRATSASNLARSKNPRSPQLRCECRNILGDVPAATAILDRFLAQAKITPMQGKSYRLRQRATKEKEDKTTFAERLAGGRV